MSLSFPLSQGVSKALSRTNTLSTGMPFRITVDGVLCERVSIDGQWATIDGQPVYMEV